MPAPSHSAFEPRREVPADAAAQVVGGRVDAASPLFRQEALDAYARGENPARLLRVTPLSGVLLLLLLGAVMLCALAVAALRSVELTAEARGILRVPGGALTVRTPTAGVVRTLGRRAGEAVREGELLFSLDTGELKARLLRAEREVELADAQLAELEGPGLLLHQEELRTLEERRGLMRRRSRQRKSSVPSLERERASLARLAEQGQVSLAERNRVERELSELTGSVLGHQQETHGLKSQSLELERARQADLRHWRGERARALNEREVAALLITQTEVRAPRAGRLETLRVQEGDLVQPGQAVAEVVADAPPSEVIVFVAENDRAFVRMGAPVRLELDQLPAGEFGVLKAHVVQMAHSLAPEEQKAALLGADADARPSFEVRLSLDHAARPLHPALRHGALVHARIKLRERRILALVFDPVRTWLE